MHQAGANQMSELREYLAVLRHRKWSVIIAAALVFGVVMLISYRQTPVYEAEARVLVEPVPPAEPTAVPSPLNIETESEIVSSRPVAALVVEDLKLDASPGSVLRNLTVEPVIETEVLLISYSSENARFAQDAANAFSRNYIEYRRQKAMEVIRAARSRIRARLESSRQRLLELTEELESARRAGDEDLVRTLEVERSLLIAGLGVLEEQSGVFQPEAATEAGSEVIQPATLPSSPSSPNHRRNAILGAVLGLIAGAGTAFVKERLDDRVRSRGGVEEVLNVPLLATIPRFDGSGPKSGRLVAAGNGAASESYRTMRANIEITIQERNLKSMAITSPLAGEGKTVTTGNLGVAMALAGRRVVLVSADFRRPMLENLLGVPNRVGLSTWLASTDNDALWPVAQPTEIANMSVVPSGPIPPNPTELLASPRFTRLLATLEEIFDFVLLDSPPLLPVADAMIIASRVRHALIVLNATSSLRSSATQIREELRRADVEMVGAVLNECDSSNPLRLLA
jgi:succinoglycan biosynthesis transport protein ExoP